MLHPGARPTPPLPLGEGWGEGPSPAPSLRSSPPGAQLLQEGGREGAFHPAPEPAGTSAYTPAFGFPLPPLPGPAAPLEALIEGESVETSRGPFFRRRTVLHLDHTYGACRLGDFLEGSTAACATLARAPELADVSLDHFLFLDTETTGLAGGTGTYAFLVGLGYFERDAATGDARLVVDQCLMRTYAEERALLTWVHEHMQRFEALLTFNGKSFDVPLLQTRFLMSRMRVDFEAWLHFDLLHAARRVWRHALASHTLQSLERHVLRTGRVEDIESFLIPAIYHQYLRDGDGRYLARVFNHNHADVLAMVALAARAFAMLDDPGEGPSSRLEPAEQLGLARIFEQMGSNEAAERAYRAGLAGRLPPELRARATMDLAALVKRAGRHDHAAELWQAVVDDLPAHSVPALLELSKYWEHRRRDPARAFDLARRARDRWVAGLPAAGRPLPGLPAYRSPHGPTAPTPPDDFTRRLERLDRKRRGFSAAEVPATSAVRAAAGAESPLPLGEG